LHPKGGAGQDPDRPTRPPTYPPSRTSTVRAFRWHGTGRALPSPKDMLRTVRSGLETPVRIQMEGAGTVYTLMLYLYGDA